MAKKAAPGKKAAGKRTIASGKKAASGKAAGAGKKAGLSKRIAAKRLPIPPPACGAGGAEVLDRLWGVVTQRRDADPTTSHSARLLARGTAKVAQKFGEEAVECLIEAIAGNRDALIAESADTLYHLIVMWVAAGVRTEEVWAELTRREGVSGITEKASRVQKLPIQFGLRTRKIP